MSRIDKKIKVIKKAALELKDHYEEVPVVERNAARILASVKMLEINISDVLAFVSQT